MKHGYANKERSYRIWKRMRSRCYCKSDKNYPRYGGRGIKICSSWDSYLNFRKWYLSVGVQDSDLQVDRIDNDGNYSPTNCRLVTRKQNTNNTRRSKWLNIRGEKITAQEASDKYDVPYWRIISRLKRGWNAEDAIFTERLQEASNNKD